MIRYISSVLWVLVLGLPVSALNCTSASHGSWSAPATWSNCSGGVPGNGDTATITHAVEVDDERTLGTSPGDATTMVLTVNAGGSLRILGGGLLRIRGNGQLNNSPLNLEANSVLEIDGSVSATAHVLRIGTATNQANARINLNGTGFSNMPELRSNAGGPNGRLARGTGTNGGMVNCTYGRLRRLGSTTQPALDYRPEGSNFNMQWDYCWLEESSQITVTGVMHEAAIFDISNSRVIDPLQYTGGASGAAFYVSCKTGSFTTGRCRFYNNYIERGIGFATASNIETERNILLAQEGSTSAFSGILGAGSGTATPQTHMDNFLFSRAATGGGRNHYGVFRGNYMVIASGNPNPHFINANTVSDTTREYNVLESLRQTGISQSGDGFLTPSGSGATFTHTTRFNLVVASPQPICSVAAGGGTASEIIAHNNTIPNNGCAGIRTGESYSGRSGFVQSYHSNAIYHPTGMGAALHKAKHNTGMDNVYVECNWNAGDSFAAGTLGNGYDMTRTNGSCGTNDLNESAAFADPDFRNIGKYYAWVTRTAYVAGDGAGASFLALLAEFRKKNTADWDERFDHIRARDWVRAGYAPRNLKYVNSGKNGGQIGAIKPVPMFGAWQ